MTLWFPLQLTPVIQAHIPCHTILTYLHTILTYRCTFDEDPPFDLLPRYQGTANLAGDPQHTLMQRMAPKPAPLVNLKEDIHRAHENVSWVFGAGDNITEMTVFQRTSSDPIDNAGSRWSCSNSTAAEYPAFLKNVLHPRTGCLLWNGFNTSSCSTKAMA